jgi:hypothetical protein
MRDRTRKVGLFALAICVFLPVAGCLKTRGQKQAEEPETPTERIQAFAYNATENLLLAMNFGDYAQFSKNFSDELRSVVSEDSYKQFAARVLDKYGTYSRNTSKQNQKQVVTNEDGTVTFVIGAWFVKEGQTDTVEVPFRITYREVDGTPKVVSLSLDDMSLAP